MNEQEKQKLQQKLSNKYEIGEQIGRTGEYTIAYNLTDKKTGQRNILLLSKEQNNPTQKLEEAIKYNAVNEVVNFCTDGYKGDVFLPKSEITPNYRIIPYAGKDFSENVYQKLSQKEKEKLSKDFAEYLNYVHQKSFDDKKNLENISYLNSTYMNSVGEIDKKNNWLKCNEYNDFKEKFKNISPKDYEKCIGLIEKYLNRNTKDEICVLTHGDLRFQNVLYDENTRKLAIIDFEMSKISSIYNDFCPYCNSGLDYEFSNNVINYYNQLPKKYPIKIDTDKVKMFWKISNLTEFVRCCREGNSPEQQIKRFNKRERLIDNCFKNKITNTDIIKHGIDRN